MDLDAEDKIRIMYKNNYCTFYIVRHGQTDWNTQKRVMGTTDQSLNEFGKIQAKEIAQQLKHITFDALFSSDLLRAQQTAEIIGLEHQLAVTTTKALREGEFGALEGKTHEEFKATLAKLTHEEQLTKPIAEGAELHDSVISRMITFLRACAINYPGKTILLISHSGTIRALLIHLGLTTYPQLPKNAIANVAYVKICSDGIDFFVEEMKGIKLHE